ncbi:hypothetical protein QBC41DRAFT_313039 [Cercophora samala]|uniref:G-patch domain-containing protein n=1 Tax=Cercophora samala TaxID=330535 RepID=A0AA39ZKS4_9PEZI|nr:hypothetical protein QBC41DRAFT_313039 [Cercophora samala]
MSSSNNKPPQNKKEEEEEEEDDYMSPLFLAPPTTTTSSSSSSLPIKETSLQRRARLRREAEARARPKSKAELALEAELQREKAHSTSLLESKPQSKGLAMMAKMGFKPGSTLGSSTSGSAEPIRVSVKGGGKEGIGLESENKRKLRELVEGMEKTEKRQRVEEVGYRERVRREKEEQRLEGQVRGAQKVAEGLDTDRARERGEEMGKRLLKGIPVVWRGLVKAREEREAHERMRRDLEVHAARRGMTYDDGEEDEDDKRALGKKQTVYEVAEDFDEEDEELDGFNGLTGEEKLRRLVEYLRGEHHYCFWCKFKYEDEKMEGCPGLTEEEHD